MARCIVQPSAEADLREIAEYIEAANPGRGVSYVAEMRSTIALYAEQPLSGRERTDVADGLRGFPFGNYVVFYRPLADGITVVRVIHAKRDLKRLS